MEITVENCWIFDVPFSELLVSWIILLGLLTVGEDKVVPGSGAPTSDIIFLPEPTTFILQVYIFMCGPIKMHFLHFSKNTKIIIIILANVFSRDKKKL